jgi:hypothetical protein
VVGTLANGLACVASEPNGVERYRFMKPSSWDKQLGLGFAAGMRGEPGGQTKNPSKNETGLDASHNIYVSSEGRGEFFS